MRTWPLLILALVACEASPPIPTPTFREVGIIPNPPGSVDRDVGFSARFGGFSVWIFGDTFFQPPASDGYTWRSSSWSYTDGTNASDGLTDWTHAVDDAGAPIALLPHTADEQAFDDAHNGNPCPAGTNCGARHTPWPGAFVVDPDAGSALVFYQYEDTGPPLPAPGFQSVGTSIATWSSPKVPAQRPVVSNLPDRTMLFGPDEPNWDAAALVDGDEVYVYACDGRAVSSSCLVARAPLSSALDHAAWEFWSGSAWLSDWRSAAGVFDGAPLMSVHFNPYLGTFIAFYMVPTTSRMALRTAERPEGPWSSELSFGQGEAAMDGTWDYALIAHPEFEQDGGQLEYLSYYQPGTFLNGTIHLIELSYQ